MTEEKRVQKILLSSELKEDRLYPTEKDLNFLSRLGNIFQIGIFEYTLIKGEKEIYLRKRKI